MTFSAFFLIVFSAVLHASWNLVAKRSSMSVAFYTLICMVACVLWVHVQFWTPVNVLSLPGKFYIFMALSVLSDMVYCLGLVRAYRTMEMSTAYPMMRSLPILLTAVVTTAAGWGEPLGAVTIIGMCVVFAGCMMIPLSDFSHVKWRDYFNSRLFFIFLVACGTTGYTIMDKQAQMVMAEFLPEISKPIRSMTFYSTRSVCLTSFLLAMVLIMPQERKSLKEIFRNRTWMPILAGLFASFTYITVLLAMNYVSNVSYVQVFRQIGLIFGMAGGIIILKEHCSLPKIVGAALILFGLVLTVLKF